MTDYRAAEVWKNDDMYTSALIFMLVDRYGPDGEFILQNKQDIQIEDHPLLWAPETIREQIKYDTNVLLSDDNLDRIMAGSVVITQPDRFFHDPYDFEFLCRVMHSAIDGDRWDGRERADAADCIWGCLEARILHPDPFPYSDFVTGYIDACIKDWNIPEVVPLFTSLGVDRLQQFALKHKYEEADPSEIGRRIYRATVVNSVKLNCQKLIKQLESLPLENGNVKPVVDQLMPLLELDGDV